MTREVAIKAIQDFIGWFKEDSLIRKALRTAIQALSQEPCTDAVSRAELIGILKEKIKTHRSTIEIADKLIPLIEQLPSVNPQPCDDAISRDFLFRVLDNFCGHDRTATITLDTLADIVYELPSVTQMSGKWIDVNERLPEDAYGCLVTVYDTDLRTQDEFENILPYTVGYDGETWNNADGEPIPFEVIAWMPLPKPYEPQESEEQTE